MPTNDPIGFMIKPKPAKSAPNPLMKSKSMSNDGLSFFSFNSLFLNV
jgi:hypothetical protein